MMPPLDEDAILAAVDLVRRSGARNFEVGYMDDDVPVEEARWYAQAEFRGARLMEQEHRGPVEAAEALARRLLAGAQCRRCGREIMLSGESGAGVCRWTRLGQKWEPGCGLPIDHSILPPKEVKSSSFLPFEREEEA